MPRGSGLQVVERVFDPARPGLVQDRQVGRPEVLAGALPETKLVSLKVLDDRGNGQSMNVLRALEYVRKDINGYGKLLRVHGVNLSLGYEFDPKWFATARAPSAPRSTGWSARGWWWSWPPATPATAASPPSPARPTSG